MSSWKRGGHTFQRLSKISISPEHKEMMNILTQEHAYGGRTVGSLLGAREAFEKEETGSLAKITEELEKLAAF